MRKNLSSFKCAECGTRKSIVNFGEYAYKLNDKYYCCYTCYMKAYRQKYSKKIAMQDKILQRIKKLKEREINI